MARTGAVVRAGRHTVTSSQAGNTILLLLPLFCSQAADLVEIVSGLGNDMEAGVSSRVCQHQVAASLHSLPQGVEGGEPVLGGGELQHGVTGHHQVVLQSDRALRGGTINCRELRANRTISYRQLQSEGEASREDGPGLVGGAGLQYQPEHSTCQREREQWLTGEPHLARSFICLDLSTRKDSVNCPNTSLPAQRPQHRPGDHVVN